MLSNRAKIDPETVKGGIFYDPAEAKYRMSILLENQQVAFSLHPSIPIFGVAYFVTFLAQMEIVELKEDFQDSLFIPYPLE